MQPDGEDVQSGMSGQSERPWGVVGLGREAKRPRSAPTSRRQFFSRYGQLWQLR